MAAYAFDSARYDQNRLYNPWGKFTRRDENKHRAEDLSRLGQPSQLSSPEIIELFMSHASTQLDVSIPRRRQVLRDFLSEAVKNPLNANRTVENDVAQSSSSRDIALLDDRHKHDNCGKQYGQQCTECRIYSTNLNIPQLYRRLGEDRRALKAEKRIIFIPNLTSAGALALAATAARRTASYLRDFLHRYLKREHYFSVSIFWGFSIEFHMPYHAMRRGRPIDDRRHILGRPLRMTKELPLRRWSTDKEELYFYEAQTSSLSIGPDEWFWTEYFLVDTYFGSEQRLQAYLTAAQPGDGFDPPLGGGGTMEKAKFDPREYWLLKVQPRIQQVRAEYTALIETFDQRMDEYERHIRLVSIDDQDITHTQTLRETLATIQIFADCISGIVDSWETFRRNQLKFFTTFAPDKLDWPEKIDNIIHNMAELDRLRQRLLTKRDRFRFELESLHTVSSLQHTGIAIAQGDNIKTLTKMTVYAAFPLLFTSAIFGMDFLHLEHPWPIFFLVLAITFILNTIAALYGSSLRRWLLWRLHRFLQ